MKNHGGEDQGKVLPEGRLLKWPKKPKLRQKRALLYNIALTILFFGISIKKAYKTTYRLLLST